MGNTGDAKRHAERLMSSERKKRTAEVLFFLLIMGLTFTAVLKGQDFVQIGRALRGMDPFYFAAALALGLLFVCLEGVMIRVLLHTMGGKSSLPRCIRYSFVGFFYSGITPSATGGQPMQLYYMTKDGNRATDSTVVLMTVALCYKLVLVLIGLGILLGFGGPLQTYLKGYFVFYILGLCLNALLVLMILGVMLFPQIMLKAAAWFSGGMVRLGIWKPSAAREEKVAGFVESYRQAVLFLKHHKGKLLEIAGLTFIQRSSVFVLTWMVYLGLGMKGTDGLTVMLLQAAVYIAADMLPVPGAQGITELMYKTVFASVFSNGYLIPSMLVSRSVNFYFLLVISLAAAAAASLSARRCEH